MVLGLKTKSRKSGSSVQADYLIHVVEIKPWPALPASRSIHSVLLQWENGTQNSGSLVSPVGDGKIEFNESFRLPVTMWGEFSGKGKTRHNLQKNCLDLNLYEFHKDKAAVKAQLLGTAAINLADYGIIKEAVIISALVSCKKSFIKNMGQPVIFVKIQPAEMDSSSSSTKGSFSKDAPFDNEGSESVSESMNNDEVEIASFTDDDVSQHSLQCISSSSVEVAGSLVPPIEGKGLESRMEITKKGNSVAALNARLEPAKPQVTVNFVIASSADSVYNREAWREERKTLGGTIANGNKLVDHPIDAEEIKQPLNRDDNNISEDKHSLDDAGVSKYSQCSSKEQIALQESFMSSMEMKNVESSKPSIDLTNVSGSVSEKYLLENGNADEVLPACVDAREFVVTEQNDKTIRSKEGKSKLNSGVKKLEEELCEATARVKMLEEELCEAAALETGLYSVVAEHGSSSNKVHAPARRLFRFYLHACIASSQLGRASAARAIASGLVLVSKACGNDVPRLSFWLSNAVVLRAIICQALGKKLGRSCIENNGGRNGLTERTSLELNKSSPSEESSCLIEKLNNREDLQAFIIVLEKIEAWIFSRIVESVWWQTLTPHMQSAAKSSNSTAGSKSRNTRGWKYDLSDHEQGNFSVQLWEEAFKDACERLCPIRAGGHECGCLSVLARLVMEQLVNRLDVAMFNAVLRESAEEMPTDPVSDPICDPKVLPIPAGKSSFGAGAQLKNAIGSWSRWLTDLFVIDDSCDDKNEYDDGSSQKSMASFKVFPLLNALSDLMMLPLELLTDKSTRKEVCPTFGVALVKRVLNNFVPDEFCPDPVPVAVLESLDSEELVEDPEDCLTSFPCIAASTDYHPPAAASLSCILGELGTQPLLRRGSSLLRKSYTSDDELDELDSPLTSIVNNTDAASSKLTWMLKKTRNVTRYDFLKEVWRIE